MKHPHDIIIKPVLTEKSYDYIPSKTYTFIVDKHANKTEIRQAVEAVFPGVKVDSVHTVNQMGKMKRQGRTEGRRASTKKAYVKLQKNSKGIEFFDSMSQ
ncbi:50S ribosomal protein L23 [Christensenellaceae bacterium OttesenSCG-928-L17]|nr:50S ribosomal protein L23 [Christensenellaceae bacterium OttesenSCG-928-L17]